MNAPIAAAPGFNNGVPTGNPPNTGLHPSQSAYPQAFPVRPDATNFVYPTTASGSGYVVDSSRSSMSGGVQGLQPSHGSVGHGQYGIEPGYPQQRSWHTVQSSYTDPMVNPDDLRGVSSAPAIAQQVIDYH